MVQSDRTARNESRGNRVSRTDAIDPENPAMLNTWLEEQEEGRRGETRSMACSVLYVIWQGTHRTWIVRSFQTDRLSVTSC